MAVSKNFGLKGVGSQVQLGKGGNQVKTGSGIVQARNAADDAFVKVQGADPTLFQDLSTERYTRLHGHVIVIDQIDGNSPPAADDQQIYICTTAGGSFNLGFLYYGENGVWNELEAEYGTSLSPATDQTGGTIEFLAGHIYVYSDGSWVDDTPPAATAVLKNLRATLNFDDSSPVNIGGALAVDGRMLSAYVNVTTAFDASGPATVSLGYAGHTSDVMDTSEVDLTTVGLYKVDCFVNAAATTQMIATFSAGSGGAQGVADIELVYSIA